jgi:hypothetical protein
MRYGTAGFNFLMAAFWVYMATGSRFYGGGVGRLAISNPIPKWLGRFVVLLVAAAFAYYGFRALASSGQ